MSGSPISVGWLLGFVPFIPIMTLHNLNCYSFTASLYPTEEFLSYCDQKGYIVWGEHANWVQDSSRTEVFENFLPEWQEIMAIYKFVTKEDPIHE